jgi:hypothetical protein
MSYFSRFVLLVLASSSLAACSGAGGGEDTASTAQPILKGTHVFRNPLGLMWIDRNLTGYGGGCSGVLLSAQWALTSGACIEQGPGKQAANLVEDFQGNGSSMSDQIYWFGTGSAEQGWGPPSPGPDLALVHLAHPIALPNAVYLSIGTTPASQLVGVRMAEYGAGQTSATGVVGDVHPSVGPYTLADPMTPYAAGNGLLDFKPTSYGEIATMGDEGGPYVVGLSIAAIESYQDTGPQGIAHATALGDYNAWIAAVFKTSWNANLSAQWIDVYQDEINGTPWAFSDVNAVGWAQSMRAASQLCYARAFAGGHFVGHEISPKVGLLCEGPQTAWFDLTPAEIAATPEPFTNVDTVGWAQANRDAGILCVNRGYVSGHFNGQQLLSSGGLFPPSKLGLLCSNANAKYYVAKASDFSSTGWSMGDVDTTSWAQAGRAANGYCTARGFVSGYLNGQENRSNRTYGVICER